MRGFRKRSTVEATLAWIDKQATRLESENLAVHRACDRVLARSVTSAIAVPAFRRAMMDGFAVRAADTLGATSYDPLYVDVVGQVLPGESFDGRMSRGEAVRIMTGAPMPAGADAVLPAEQCSVSNEQLAIYDQVAPEKHVGQIGEDIPLGTEVLSTGRRLRPQDLGVLSSVGRGTVEVIRRPCVRLLITGDELCAAGSLPERNQTVDANSPMLSALIARDGGTVLFDGITPDQPAAIQAAMEDAAADVVIVSGGSSVGQEDHAPRILAELGELAIHGVAMRPSSPTGMGRIGNRLVFLLPGNPVSCLCAYDFFAGRAVRLLGGRLAAWPYPKFAGILNRKISSVVGRQDYARVKVNGADVEPIAVAGASALSSTSLADGFVVVPADSEGFPPDAEVEVFLYD
jgi:molybdopterin molybdotransferase